MTWRWRITGIGIGILLVIAALLSACGSNSIGSTNPTASTIHQGSYVPLTGSPSPSTVPSTSTSTGIAIGQSTCRIDQLRVSAGKAGAAAGSIAQTVLFTNVGQITCTITGYPGVAALDAQGNQVVQAERRLEGMVGGIRSGTTIPVVNLGPGQVASAEIEGSDVSVRSCPTYPAFLVTPPGETHSAQISAGVAGSGLPGFQGCGDISVNPVVPGTTGTLS